jgi:hypothetical protein
VVLVVSVLCADAPLLSFESARCSPSDIAALIGRVLLCAGLAGSAGWSAAVFVGGCG